MAEDTDFVALYDELGLDAECSMAEFKRSYRRRVAQLHPDHPENSSDISRLQRLNRQYAAALQFHYTHGRLPGAVRNSAVVSRTGTTPEPEQEFIVETLPVSGSRSRWRYPLLVALVGLVLYGLSIQPPAPAVSDVPEPNDAKAKLSHQPTAEKLLAIGMDSSEVRRIQGQSFNSNEFRWEYGPSWILFNCGKVVDWYSSPLHPLQVRSASPTDNARSASGRQRKC